MKAWLEAQRRGPVEIKVGRTGQFDVVVDGRVAFSKYDSGRFPTDADLESIPS